MQDMLYLQRLNRWLPKELVDTSPFVVGSLCECAYLVWNHSNGRQIKDKVSLIYNMNRHSHTKAYNGIIVNVIVNILEMERGL